MSVTIVRNLNERGLRQAAALHRALLPGSAVSRFGANFACSFYRYAARSSNELVFAGLDDDAIVAAAVISLRPEGLQRRLLIHTPLLAHMALHPLIACHVLRDRLSEQVEGNFEAKLAEVVAIFTAPTHQGRGLGAQLLRAIEKELSKRGLTRYGLRTKDVAGNRAIEFYDRQGFVVVGHAHTPHSHFRIMTKQIGGG